MMSFECFCEYMHQTTGKEELLLAFLMTEYKKYMETFVYEDDEPYAYSDAYFEDGVEASTM